MKKVLIVAMALAVCFCFTTQVMAESATKEECVEKVKSAAAMLKLGVDAVAKEINKKDGKFVWKDTYVFMMDLDGKMLAHPMKPSLIGKNLLSVKDANGTELFKLFMDVAKSKGEGWVDYVWPKPGEEKPSPKTSYIYRVPGQNIVLGAGIYK